MYLSTCLQGTLMSFGALCFVTGSRDHWNLICSHMHSGGGLSATAPLLQSVPHHRTSSRPNRGRQEFDDEDEEVSEDEEGSAYQDGEGDPCPNCGRVYR